MNTTIQKQKKGSLAPSELPVWLVSHGLSVITTEECAFLLGLFDTRVVGIERIFHRVTPATLRIIPATGSSGIKGQTIIRLKLIMPINNMIMQPTKSKINLDVKPIKRETSLSKNM